MKRLLIVCLLLLTGLPGISQTVKEIKRLDELFFGVPLKENYVNWVAYISNHPRLGIDSTSDWGVYSSIKPGSQNHFPFTGSVGVKLLAAREAGPVLGKDMLRYSMKIEGLFGKDKQAVKKCYREIKQMIRPHYRKSDGDYFLKGENEDFPDCYLGWEYSPLLQSYIVVIEI